MMLCFVAAAAATVPGQLPCPAPPCPALPCPDLVCPALPRPALPWFGLPCPAMPSPFLPCPAVYYALVTVLVLFMSVYCMLWVVLCNG